MLDPYFSSEAIQLLDTVGASSTTAAATTFAAVAATVDLPSIRLA